MTFLHSFCEIHSYYNLFLFLLAFGSNTVFSGNYTSSHASVLIILIARDFIIMYTLVLLYYAIFAQGLFFDRYSLYFMCFRWIQAKRDSEIDV